MAQLNIVQPEPHSAQHLALDSAAGPFIPSSPDMHPNRHININYAECVTEANGLKSRANLEEDGRIRVSLDIQDANRLPGLQPHESPDEFGVDRTAWSDAPAMCIVIMIVGSRGDVQPYVGLGKRLVRCGHRVRIATHETFRTFVTNEGLEFFNIGGNPQDLLSYMVKNPGLMPGLASLTNGDIGRKRKMLKEMIHGSWRSCFMADPLSGKNFVADVIISNPPAFAHIHCAEALGIPLQMSFTMPWTPTTAFPQPLVSISNSNASSSLSNYLSYNAADLLTWQGVGDIINTFRNDKLGLSQLSIRTGPGLLDRLQVPWTYCMSPALVPKPDDWRANIDVVGFYFLDLASNYTPSPELEAFLAAGEPPVYIGFGSVVVDDPAGMSKTIFTATKQAGVRALVSAGWGGLGGVDIPSHIFMLGNIPHDWLFSNNRVSAVVHHGGAGTTAIGLAKGRPTVIVPFFGDQTFWGNMIYKAGAGPKPIPGRDLSVKKLTEALKFALSPGAKKAAEGIAESIKHEHGVRKGLESLYRHLPLLNMRCDIIPSRIAAWWDAEHCMKLSPLAAQTLSDAKLIDLDSLYLHRESLASSSRELDLTLRLIGSKYYDHPDARRTCEAYCKSLYTRFYNASPAQLAKLYSDGLIPSRPSSRSGSTDNSPQSPLKILAPDSPGPTDKIFDAVVGAAKNFIHRKLAFGSCSPDVPSSPPKRPECSIHEKPIRLVRLAEGVEVWKSTTQAERDVIIAKFNAETHAERKSSRRATVDEMVKRLPMHQIRNKSADERTTAILKDDRGAEIGITVEEPLSLDDAPFTASLSASSTSPPPIDSASTSPDASTTTASSGSDVLTFPEPEHYPLPGPASQPVTQWDSSELEKTISRSLEDPDAQFNQELEMAMRLSLEECRKSNPTAEEQAAAQT